MLYCNTYHCNMFDISNFESVEIGSTGDKCMGCLTRAADAKLVTDLPMGDNIWISFEFNPTDWNNSNYILTYKYGASSTMRLRIAIGNPQFRLDLITNTTQCQTISGIVAGKWYRVDLNVDKLNQKVVVYLNGLYIYEEPFTKIVADCIEISFDVCTKKYTYFRNIIITDEFDTRGYKVKDLDSTIETDWNREGDSYSTDEANKNITFNASGSIENYSPKKIFVGMNVETGDTVNSIDVNIDGQTETKQLDTNFISVNKDIDSLDNKQIVITSKYTEG